MSSHRAEKQDPSGDASNDTELQSGRRRAVRAPRRRSTMSLSSMIGAAALLVAGVGAATASQAISSQAAPASSRTQGGYVANLSAASLEGRDATEVSRSGARPSSTNKVTAVTQAEKAASARNNLLRNAANSAESYATELASDEWVLPTSGFHITVWFGEPGPYWASGYHTGIDFATAYGTPAVAVTNAVVAQAGWDGPYGNQIRLTLENGDEVWYNHLSAIEVTVGETILKGEEIGRIGETGNAFGYHLHFEYRLASDLTTAVDPKPFFAAHGITL